MSVLLTLMVVTKSVPTMMGHLSAAATVDSVLIMIQWLVLVINTHCSCNSELQYCAYIFLGFMGITMYHMKGTMTQPIHLETYSRSAADLCYI